jgi:AraC-like DNA-binding protein
LEGDLTSVVGLEFKQSFIEGGQYFCLPLWKGVRMPTTSEHGLVFTQFDASALAPAERFDCWQHRLTDAFRLSLPEGAAPHQLEAQTSVWALDGLMLSPRICGAHILTRDANTVRTMHLDHYKLHVRAGAGATRVQAGETRRRLQRGEFVITDMARPECMDVDAGPTVALFIPRDALDVLLPQPLDLHGVAPTGACAGMFADHVAELVRQMPRMRPEEVEGTRLATLHLLAASLAPTAAMLTVARPAVEDALRRQVCRFIELRLTDEGLHVRALCARFRVSRSMLYRLFEPMGGVANYIKERRLARVRTVLASAPRWQSVARIAESYGFKSPTHFSRAFREQFGYSPRDVQRAWPAARGGDGANGIDRVDEAAAPVFGQWLQALHD